MLSFKIESTQILEDYILFRKCWSQIDLNFRITGHGPLAENGGARRVVLLGRRLGFTVRGHRLPGGSGEDSVQTGPNRPFHRLSGSFKLS